jgi:CheY-like chemotaxis protein
MNNAILVIEQTKSSISEQLNCRKLEYSNQSKDEDIHHWLIANKEIVKGVEKLVIPVRLGDEDAEYMGLYIGLHIRLTKELEDFRFLPILFISEDSKDEILTNQINYRKQKSGLLLFTKGSYLLSLFSLESFIEGSILSIDEQILIEEILPNLKIENTKDLGHQLANDWGAFRLAKFAGYKLSINMPCSLYFKYKDILTNNEIVPIVNNNIGLVSETCKAILIDDNANAGWSDTVEYILKRKIINPAKATSLKVLTTYEDAIKFSNYIEYDIVFLDLRLLKEEDRPNQIDNVESFTGTKILEAIKRVNQGIQVIIFTASNKVWNIEKLIEKGANGYYIKESPEYILSTKFSKDNYSEFLSTIKNCLIRKPLKNVYFISQNLSNSIAPLIKSKKMDKDFGRSVLSYIELGNKIIESAKTENDFAMSYLILFKCIELIKDNFTIKNNNTWEITVSGPLKQFRYDFQNNNIYECTPVSFENNTATTFERIAGFSSQVVNFTLNELVDLYHNIQRRNKFIHPDDSKNLTSIQVDENKKIFTYDGYTKLIESLYLIFSRL